MPAVTFVDSNGALYRVNATADTSLMRAAIEANVPGIDAECGGCCSCATCHVYLDEAGWKLVPAAQDDEVSLLEFVAAERRPHSRLSCQIALSEDMKGLVAMIPSTQV